MFDGVFNTNVSLIVLHEHENQARPVIHNDNPLLPDLILIVNIFFLFCPKIITYF